MGGDRTDQCSLCMWLGRRKMYKVITFFNSVEPTRGDGGNDVISGGGDSHTLLYSFSIFMLNITLKQELVPYQEE